MLLNPKNFLFSFLFFSFCLCSKAQDNTIDRLCAVISSSAKDEEKLSAYIQLSGKISFVSFNETIKVAE